MDKQFTPGPWRVYGGMLDGYGIVSQKGDNIYSTNHKRPLQIFNGDEEEANARLIAAAPDLYEALQTVELAIRLDHLEERAGWKNLHETIKQALAKAGK